MEVLLSKQAIEQKCLSALEKKVLTHVAALCYFEINIKDVSAVLGKKIR